MKSLTGSLLPRRWAGRGGAEPGLAGTKGAAGRGRKGVRAGEGVGDVTPAGWLACSETPPPVATQSDPTHPDPRRRHPAPGRPRAPRPRTPKAEETMGLRCPNPPYRDLSCRRPAPGTPSPRSAPSPVRSCGHRRGPSISRCPLPRLRLRRLHSGQESPARRPQTSGTRSPPPRLRLRASHCTVCPSLSLRSAVIGQLSTSVRVIATPSPPLSPGHTRTHSGQRLVWV